jgi:hypothetical protein
METSSRTNVSVIACASVQAQLKLNYLQRLGDSVLYCDTDSVVLTSSYGQWKPSLGDFLVDLTGEVTINQKAKFVTGRPCAYC